MQFITHQDKIPRLFFYNEDDEVEEYKFNDLKVHKRKSKKVVKEINVTHDINVAYDDYGKDIDNFVLHNGLEQREFFFEDEWINNAIARNGWINTDIKKRNKHPSIPYHAGGHISPHFDRYDGFAVDSHQATFLICIGSNDYENGGTMFYFGNEKYIAKESVTSKKAVIFPTYIYHSGVPVSDGKYKNIIQVIIRETRKRVSKEDLIKIDLKDGSYVVRKDEFQYLDGSFENMTKKEFFPTYVGLRGHPTINPMIKDMNYVYGKRVMEYDTVAEDWFTTMDEAAYYADNRPIVATIHFGKNKFKNITVDEFQILMASFSSNYVVDETPVQYPFIKHARTHEIVKEDYGKTSEYNYVHVAWRIVHDTIPRSNYKHLSKASLEILKILSTKGRVYFFTPIFINNRYEPIIYTAACIPVCEKVYKMLNIKCSHLIFPQITLTDNVEFDKNFLFFNNYDLVDIYNAFAYYIGYSYEETRNLFKPI